MAKVQVTKHTFTNDKGDPVEYERLSIIGYVSGEIHTLELKLSSSEILLAKMLLNSEEDKPETVSRKANEEEENNFLDKNKHRPGDDEIDLDE